MVIPFMMSRPGAAAIVFAIAAGIVYGLMIFITLGYLEDLSGLAPLDMRPFGYDPSEVTSLFNALGAKGRHFYLTRQIPLDVLYPALLALTLISIVLLLTHNRADRNLFGIGPRVGIGLAISVAVFDYAENLGIAVMLMNWPKLSDGTVFASSLASVLKAHLTLLAVAYVLCLWGKVARRKGR